jgi:hypothetical protein
LTGDEKQQLVKLHKNLVHPDPMVLSAHLKAQGATEQIIRAAQDFICDACDETQSHTINDLQNSTRQESSMMYWGLMDFSGKEKVTFSVMCYT